MDMGRPPTEAEATLFLAPDKYFSLGCHFGSMIMDVLLLGVVFMQVTTYVGQCKRDNLFTKLIVVWASVGALGMSGYVIFFQQYLFVQNFGIYAPFFETRYLSVFPLLDSIYVGIIQVYFAHRAYLIMKRQIWILIAVGLLCLASVASTISVKIIFAAQPSLLDAYKVQVPENIWLSCTMAADLIITGCIMKGLLSSRTGWTHTDKTITRLIKITMESQLPPTLVAVAFLIEFAIKPASLLGALLQTIQSKIYAVGLLFALNSRHSFNASLDDKSANVYGLSERTRAQPTEIQVEVETETYVQSSFHDSDNKKALGSDFGSDHDVKFLTNSSQARLTGPDKLA